MFLCKAAISCIYHLFLNSSLLCFVFFWFIKENRLGLSLFFFSGTDFKWTLSYRLDFSNWRTQTFDPNINHSCLSKHWIYHSTFLNATRFNIMPWLIIILPSQGTHTFIPAIQTKSLLCYCYLVTNINLASINQYNLDMSNLKYSVTLSTFQSKFHDSCYS